MVIVDSGSLRRDFLTDVSSESLIKAPEPGISGALASSNCNFTYEWSSGNDHLSPAGLVEDTAVVACVVWDGVVDCVVVVRWVVVVFHLTVVLVDCTVVVSEWVPLMLAFESVGCIRFSCAGAVLYDSKPPI